MGCFLVLAVYFLKRKRKIILTLFWSFLALTILRSLFFSVLNYFAWKENSFTVYLLPPYSPLSYFLGYSYTHYFSSLILLITAVSIFILFLLLFQKKSGRVIIDEEDVSAFFVCSLLVQWPLIIVLIFFSIVAAVIWAVSRQTVFKKYFSGVNDSSLTEITPFFILLTPAFILFSEKLIKIFLLNPLVMPLY